MFKLAGALLTNPALLKRAAGMPSASAAVKGAARLAGGGGSELISAAIPGSLLTAGLSTITTGNPLAGLAIGAADLGLSVGSAKAIQKYAPNLAGKYSGVVSAKNLEKYKGSSTIPQDVLTKTFEPSIAQHSAMLAGSIAAPLILEPMFMGQPAQSSQYVTQAQQLGQQETLNDMYMPYTANGTMYQVQGLPQRVV